MRSRCRNLTLQARMCRRDQRFTYSRSKRCALCCCRKILERFGARLENHRGCDTYYPAIGFLLLIIILGLQTKRQRNRVVNRGEGACVRAAAAASTKSANDHRDSYLSELCQTAAHLPGVACCVLPPIPRRLCEISWRHWRNRRHCHTKCSPDLMANSLKGFPSLHAHAGRLAHPRTRNRLHRCRYPQLM